MERTKKEKQAEPNQVPLWVNRGGSSFYLRTPNGKDPKIIKPNEKFRAEEGLIPEALRDVIVPFDPLPSQVEKELVRKTKSPAFEVVVKGGGWFNVVNSEGKVMNEKALHKEDADELCKALQAGGGDEE